MRRVLVVGLDCLGPELLAPESLAELPALAALAARGTSGPLESVLPPITVPAWSCMLTGRDPGELGTYGFRNRRSWRYGDLVRAGAGAVRFPRVWDRVGQAGGRSVVVGVPQTWPPPAIEGWLVSGLHGGRPPGEEEERFTHPPELAAEVRAVAGEAYAFDVDDFRTAPRREVLARVVEMTDARFRLMEHLLATRGWDFAMLCEIGPDRVHHCFWSDHDPAHPRHDSASPDREVIRGYYRHLDHRLAGLLAAAGPDTTVLVASDHGARAMQGGVCVNEVLRRAGWLRLKREPEGPAALDPADVDWGRTRAWAEGGYYARVFLNVAGREPQGVLAPEDREGALREMAALLEEIPLDGGPVLRSRAVRPESVYRRVRGFAPDLIVLFGDLAWRSLGSVGHPRNWLAGNDTGVDEANHARDGMYVLAGEGIPHRRDARASLLDVAPTLLDLMDLETAESFSGRSLLVREAA